MHSRQLPFLACAVVAAFFGMSVAVAQNQPPPNAPAQYSQAQLDQLTAPIALYPDQLVADILMAAAYPLEVVEADRWVQDPENAALAGDDLTTALDGESWDPSVESLVPYPPALQMMDDNLEWTEALGDAVVADQAGVMDSIQRLRASAQSKGYLSSTPQETVSQQGQDIAIAPANADTVYVPMCDPTVVFGAWPHPDYPPYQFADTDSAPAFETYGCEWWGAAIFAPFWGWSSWDWWHHNIVINRARFAALNAKRPPQGKDNSWHYDPAQRQAVPRVNAALRGHMGGMAPPPTIVRNNRFYAARGAAVRARHSRPVSNSVTRGRAMGANAMRAPAGRATAPIRGAHPPPGHPLRP